MTAAPGLPALLTALAVLVLFLPGPAAARLREALPPVAVEPRPQRVPSGRRRLIASLLLVPAAALLVVRAGGLGPAFVLVVGVAGVRQVLRARVRSREDEAERRGAAEACAALAAELRAGRSPAEALESAVPVAQGALRTRLQGAAAAARLGGDPAAALTGPGPVGAVPQVSAGLAACWQVCAGTGSGLAAAVDRLDDGLRAAEVARRAVEAELAGPRATAGLLAVLPLGGIGLAAALGAHPLQVLLHSRVGGVCLVVGVLLDGAGLLWTRRLADRAAA